MLIRRESVAWKMTLRAFHGSLGLTIREFSSLRTCPPPFFFKKKSPVKLRGFFFLKKKIPVKLRGLSLERARTPRIYLIFSNVFAFFFDIILGLPRVIPSPARVFPSETPIIFIFYFNPSIVLVIIWFYRQVIRTPFAIKFGKISRKMGGRFIFRRDRVS